MRITWLGTAGFVIESPETTLLVDPFVTRPGFTRLASRMIPDDLAIARHVPRKVDAVLCGHSHFDHVADAPRIAKHTKAKLVDRLGAWDDEAPTEARKAAPASSGRMRVEIFSLFISVPRS